MRNVTWNYSLIIELRIVKLLFNMPAVLFRFLETVKAYWLFMV